MQASQSLERFGRNRPPSEGGFDWDEPRRSGLAIFATLAGAEPGQPSWLPAPGVRFWTPRLIRRRGRMAPILDCPRERERSLLLVKGWFWAWRDRLLAGGGLRRIFAVSPGVTYPKSRLSGCGAGRAGVRDVPWLSSRTHLCPGVGA